MSDLEFNCAVSLSLEDVMDKLQNLNYPELIQFIRDLDNAIGDWDFTKDLGKMVHELYKELSEEQQENIEYRHEDGCGVSVSLEEGQWTGHVFEKDKERPTRCRCGHPEVFEQHAHIFSAGKISDEMCICGLSRLSLNHQWLVVPAGEL